MSNFKSPVVAVCAALALLVCVMTPASTMAQCVTPPSGMTNWWTADGHTFDIIGGEHGSLQGGATFDTGRVLQAFSLDGVNDFVRVPNDPGAAFNFTGSFSIDAWIFLKATSAEFAPIVSKWNDIGVHRRNYFLTAQSFGGFNRLRFDVSADGLFLGGHSSAIVSADVIPLNTWTHVAGVFNGTTHSLTVYVNGHASVLGSDISPTVSAPLVNNEPVLIGAGDLGSNQRDFFKGLIDEVELFNRAISQAEIQSIVNASRGKVIPVGIDIKPGGEPNPINLGSKGKVPVAILSSETFDATTVNVQFVTFAGAPVVTKNNGTFMASFEDVNGDGRPDLVLHFATQSMNLTSSSTDATLTGLTISGRCIAGTDSVKIVP